MIPHLHRPINRSIYTVDLCFDRCYFSPLHYTDVGVPQPYKYDYFQKWYKYFSISQWTNNEDNTIIFCTVLMIDDDDDEDDDDDDDNSLLCNHVENYFPH